MKKSRILKLQDDDFDPGPPPELFMHTDSNIIIPDRLSTKDCRCRNMETLKGFIKNDINLLTISELEDVHRYIIEKYRNL